MEKVKFINTDNGKVSIQVNCPEIDGKIQPMEMYIVVENEKGDILLYNFNKVQAKKLMKHFKKAIGLVNCFG